MTLKQLSKENKELKRYIYRILLHGEQHERQNQMLNDKVERLHKSLVRAKQVLKRMASY